MFFSGKKLLVKNVSAYLTSNSENFKFILESNYLS